MLRRKLFQVASFRSTLRESNTIFPNINHMNAHKPNAVIAYFTILLYDSCNGINVIARYDITSQRWYILHMLDQCNVLTYTFCGNGIVILKVKAEPASFTYHICEVILAIPQHLHRGHTIKHRIALAFIPSKAASQHAITFQHMGTKFCNPIAEPLKKIDRLFFTNQLIAVNTYFIIIK